MRCSSTILELKISLHCTEAVLKSFPGQTKMAGFFRLPAELKVEIAKFVSVHMVKWIVARRETEEAAEAVGFLSA